MALQMGFSLVQEQRMKLVMTPELRQVIQLLQYSAADLQTYLEEQFAENPVLELEDAALAELEKWLKHLTEHPEPRRKGYSREERTDARDYARAQTGTLADELMMQLREMRLPKQERSICEYMIYSLDERGYLDLELVEICKRFQISEKLAEKCLSIIQEMDPIGVGARNLGECLEIQLRHRDTPNELAIRIARSHLEDVADGKWRKIAQALGVDVPTVQAAVDEIKSCHPRPGAAYASEPPRYVAPDVVVEKVDGEYVVLLEEGEAPRLTINAAYQRLIKQRERLDEDVAQYLKNWVQSAMWLIKGIEQRRDTIIRVAEAIVSKQKAFLDHGVDYLRPLTLKQIAEDVGLHESTVSRATQHKYIQTPRGLYPFRYFFPSGLSTHSGEGMSQKTVQKKIKILVEGEDKKQPLSDQKIADLLKLEGIRISRRTIAKYREELGIASSTGRKRFL
ncbi:RNA polymerase RpoN-/SigL-like sigma 54 subunit [Laceyella sacchari]|uniref:RNA polymerase factor sigma-54 n=1 Tax=Laceyella sacchari TaxID=37482 RepID=UPI0010D7EA24|nr:RNA polymerase factor sigma-54 [Laceyella sacchari]TCW39084.1 RNA polymerase RpoN-/SigL-like sigma 54 subunit [Laceyella sacchari]